MAIEIVACGGSPSGPAAEIASSTSNAASFEPLEPHETTPAAAPSGEPVSWTMWEPMSVDRNGVVTMSDRVLGTLSAEGLIGPDGTVFASVDREGFLTFEGRRTDIRISGHEVREHAMSEREELVLQIDGGELVWGTEERMRIENLRPDRIADVLPVSAAVMVGMAAAFQH